MVTVIHLCKIPYMTAGEIIMASEKNNEFLTKSAMLKLYRLNFPSLKCHCLPFPGYVYAMPTAGSVISSGHADQSSIL